METYYACLLFLDHKRLQLGGTPEDLRGLENVTTTNIGTVVRGLIHASFFFSLR